ncbi:MAG: lipoate--protein ligase family protein [Thaumarchaeota archaeon]|nr:lipoate--protein ligase family protein [Nitrososphaerota archaeon]
MSARFLDCTLGDPYANLAMEEALFRLAETPALRVWENQRSVVIGRGQLAEAETDLDYCRRFGVPVVRRFTAGGTVYNGPGNTNWTFVVPRGSSGGLPFDPDPKRVFSAFAEVLVKALGANSYRASFDPPNRITDGDGNKISGMAAYVSRSALICHGTLLYKADLAEVERLTKGSGEGVPGRYPRSRHAVVANCGVGREEFVGALRDASGAKGEGLPTIEEEKLAEELSERKYRRPEWNLGDPFSLDYT